jgi:hypothetical protein
VKAYDERAFDEKHQENLETRAINPHADVSAQHRCMQQDGGVSCENGGIGPDGRVGHDIFCGASTRVFGG